MSRGRSRGGGSGRGGRGIKAGPATPWTANEPASPAGAGPTTKEREARTMPAPKFPAVTLPVPTPLTASEKASVAHYRSFRSRIRDGPLYAVLDRSEMLDEDGKPGTRRGWNAFEGMEREGYSSRYRRGKRGIPDLRTFRNNIRDENEEGGFALPFFPRELWSTLDPRRSHPAWATSNSSSQPSKRSRSSIPSSIHSSDSERDPTRSSPKRSRREKTASPTLERLRQKSPLFSRKRRQSQSQKKGLEAEDDLGAEEDGEDGEVKRQQEEVGEGEEGEDVAEDSAFEESDDGAGDDYNAENYFDGGDDDDGAGGFEDGGGEGGKGGGDDSGYY